MNDFCGYYVQRGGGPDHLWTVGFDRPDTGEWEPESNHDGERDAKRRAWELNGIERRFAYLRSEPGLWTVGDCGRGYWDPVSDHSSAREAAGVVRELNG